MFDAIAGLILYTVWGAVLAAMFNDAMRRMK